LYKILVLLLLSVLLLPLPVSAVTAAREPDGDLARHPLYSKFDFGKPSQRINFGAQPLSVPIGVIGEVMKRDRVLRNALGEIGFEIRFHPFLKGDDINFFLRQGKIDIALLGDMPTIMTASAYDIVGRGQRVMFVKAPRFFWRNSAIG
jgi:hypothetical protein